MKDIIRRYFAVFVCAFAVMLLILGVSAAKTGSRSLIDSTEPVTASLYEIGRWISGLF